MNITPEEWKARCARHYMERAGANEHEAMHWAAECWEERTSDDDSPERAADEDMSYWENDE